MTVEGQVDGVDNLFRGRIVEVTSIVDSDDTIRSQQRTQVAKEVVGEERQRFCSASEYVMEDVVVLLDSIMRGILNPRHSVLQHGGVVFGQVEVSRGVFVDLGVELHDGRIDAMGDESLGCSSNAQSSVGILAAEAKSRCIVDLHYKRALLTVRNVTMRCLDQTNGFEDFEDGIDGL